jgi:hypothetical protein
MKLAWINFTYPIGPNDSGHYSLTNEKQDLILDGNTLKHGNITYNNVRALAFKEIED